MRIARCHFFRTRDSHINTAFIEHRRAGNVRKQALIHIGLPEQLPRMRVHRVNVGFPIAKEAAYFVLPWPATGPIAIAVRTCASAWNDQ